jgi:tetratricopeptide (TPR) repeat protein
MALSATMLGFLFAQPAATQDPQPAPKAADVPASENPESDSAKGDEEPLKPIPDPQEFGPVEIDPASFKGVTPGATTLEEVQKAWGAPKEIQKRDGMLLHLYTVEPFDRIEVSFFDNKVTSLVIRFNRTFSAQEVAQQLDLAKVRPVLVSSELGEILGQAYPERGVLFAFEPSAEPGKMSAKVAQIVLEPIGAEPFVLRAETHLETQTKASLADLEQALKLEPKNARALWLYGRLMASMGDYQRALESASEAVRLEADNPRYRVSRAQILGQMGRLAEAIEETEKASDVGKSRPHVQARARCLLGDLTASGPKPDYKQAMRYHSEAIKAADALTAQRHPAVRVAAKEVLIDAHLGAAHDIAWGEWKEKEAAVTKWLDRAAALAEDLVKTEGASQEQQFRVAARALAACVGLRGKLDPAPWIKEAKRSGEGLIEASQDPICKAQHQWQLGMALYDALQVYQMRNDHETALKHGESAVDYLEQGSRAPAGAMPGMVAGARQTPATAYLLGRLYFRLGAIHAIRDQNHRAAISWFEKAIPLLDRPIPQESLADQGRHGETFVSMGVSYWEAGQREKAVELTTRGVALMEQAVKQGMLKESALGIPYGNLAAMHRQLGAESAADRYQEMAAKIKHTKVN